MLMQGIKHDKEEKKAYNRVGELDGSQENKGGKCESEPEMSILR